MLYRHGEAAYGGTGVKDSLSPNKPRRTPDHPTKSHVVLAKEGGKEKLIRFGEQGAKTAGKPKAGESEKMKKKRASFKARHSKNIKKGRCPLLTGLIRPSGDGQRFSYAYGRSSPATVRESGQGCAKRPEKYPAKPQGGMSHGPQLMES